MPLPDERDLTYIPNVTEIPSSNLNGLQDWMVAAWSVLRRSAFSLIDDFTGDTINQGNWYMPGGVITPVLVNDSTAGGSGAAACDPAAGQTVAFATQRVVPNTADLRWYARVRAPSGPTHAASLFKLGLTGLAADDMAYFIVPGGANTWHTVLGNAAPVDTTVAVGVGAYQDLEIRYTQTEVQFWIAGTVRRSVARPVFAAQSVLVQATRDAADGVAVELRVDAVKLWFAR